MTNDDPSKDPSEDVLDAEIVPDAAPRAAAVPSFARPVPPPLPPLPPFATRAPAAPPPFLPPPPVVREIPPQDRKWVWAWTSLILIVVVVGGGLAWWVMRPAKTARRAHATVPPSTPKLVAPTTRPTTFRPRSPTSARAFPATGADAGLSTPFMGLDGNARRVVYLCDSTGSMMAKFDLLRQELRKSTGALKPVQSFDIVFFSEDGYTALAPELLTAIPDNQRKAQAFIDRTAPHGSSNPIPALRAAFAARPQLIYFLTDGDFPNNEEVRAEIRKLNAGGRVRINTIAFIDRDESYETFLRQLAQENGGRFKFVDESSLAR